MKGVMTGVALSAEEVQLKLKLLSVCDACCLVRRRSGGECGERHSVMLSFDAESLPDKVMVGSVSYPMRAFVPKILWCFRCQVYGHVAAVCRRESPRCVKCAGGHETKECVVSVEKVVCVSCGVAHGAGAQRCPVRERQVEVARVRLVQKVLYAEAVKRVVEEDSTR